jgi:holo-[acyl-carrier protein] synthase
MAGGDPAGDAMIVGVGIDVVEIARFKQALDRTQGLADRLFCEEERGLPMRSLAARFAAKEALAKALGAPRGLSWTDAEVVTGPDGRPELKLSGTVADAAVRRGVRRWHVSLSHDGDLATAVVIAESEEDAEGTHGQTSGLGWV